MNENKPSGHESSNIHLYTLGKLRPENISINEHLLKKLLEI